MKNINQLIGNLYAAPLRRATPPLFQSGQSFIFLRVGRHPKTPLPLFILKATPLDFLCGVSRVETSSNPAAALAPPCLYAAYRRCTTAPLFQSGQSFIFLRVGTTLNPRFRFLPAKSGKKSRPEGFRSPQTPANGSCGKLLKNQR